MTGLVGQLVAVPPAATYALRQRVLRPHQRVEDMAQPGDDDPSTVHLAVLSDDGTVTACLRLQRVVCPWRDGPDGWQLRAMAVDEPCRGQGLGAALIERATAHVARAGGGLLWCNARVSAQAFYQGAGFTVVTGGWNEPDIGPHIGMLRPVAPAQVAT